MTSGRDIVRGALTRFYPGAVAGMAATAIAVGPFEFAASQVPRFIGGSLLGAAIATAGYGLALSLVRKRLRPDAAVVGRKSVVAGVAAAIATVALLPLIPGGIAANIAVGVAGGFLATLGIYFPWLSGSPEPTKDPASRGA